MSNESDPPMIIWSLPYGVRTSSIRRRWRFLQPEQIGGEANPVGHRHHDVLLDHDQQESFRKTNWEG
jgi:hypothetical protein